MGVYPKQAPEGISKPKARLVARGYTQKWGVDYDITYSPVAYLSVIRFLFAYAASHRLNMHQFDLKTDFLYGDLSEEVFMEQPVGSKDNTGRI